MTTSSLDSARIGREVAKLRKQQNISTTELARRVGLSQPQISRLENGKQGFRSETLSRISKALGVTPAHFFIEDEDTVRTERQRNHRVRHQMGREFANSIERQFGEIAVTPAFRHIVRRLAADLASTESDAKLLRRLLDRVLSLSDEKRKEILVSLSNGKTKKHLDAAE